MKRMSKKVRKTNETEVIVNLNIDGMEERKINTGIGFLDHMLDLLAYWGHFDLEVIVKKNDFNIDIHHTNEDVGIVLGDAFKEALGDKRGIKRFGFSSVPMEDTVASVTLDISGRGFFSGIKTSLNQEIPLKEQEGYSFEYANHFFEAFSKRMGMNLDISLLGIKPDLHTNLEPIFKALGIALDLATQIDPRRRGIPSTKGVID